MNRTFSTQTWNPRHSKLESSDTAPKRDLTRKSRFTDEQIVAIL